MLCNRLHVAFTSHLNDCKCGSLHLLFGIIECLGPGCRERMGAIWTGLFCQSSLRWYLFFFFAAQTHRCSRPVGSLVSTSSNSLQLSGKMKSCSTVHGPPADHLMPLPIFHELISFCSHHTGWKKWANKDESSVKTLRGSVLNYAAVWWSTQWPWHPANPATSRPAGRPRLAGLGAV